jgi:hypothetical protein
MIQKEAIRGLRSPEKCLEAHGKAEVGGARV